MSPLSLDTEATDLNWYKLQPEGFSLCDGKRTCYISWKPSYSKTLSSLINSCSELIMHNASFDLKVLQKMKVDYLSIPNIFDTMIGAWILNENKERGLKDLAKRILNIPDSDILTYEEAIKYGSNSETFYNYAMNDSIWAYQLYEVEKPLIEKQGMDYLFYEIEMPFQKVIAEMSINGFLVDKEKAFKMRDFVAELLVEKKKQLCESANIPFTTQTLIDGSYEVIPTINFNSTPQMVNVIEELGLKITEMTKPSKRFPKGQKSVGKETIRRLSGQHKFIDLYDEYTSLEKLYTSYLLTVENFIDEDDRIRCDLNAAGTVTGRLSASNPNLENLPNPLKTSLPVNYRDIFIAPKGKTLIVCDYSGQELRGLAEVSQDPALIEAFKNDKDIHLSVTNSCLQLGIPDEALYTSHPDNKKYKTQFKQERDKLKNGVVFPLIYGKTAYGMAKDMNISEDLAQEWIDGFLNLYPKVRDSIDLCASFLKRSGYVKNKNGRRRRLNKTIPKSYRQGFNFLIQGLAADEMKLACSSCQKLKFFYPEWELKLLLPVHDEIVMEINDTYTNEAIPIIKNRMENCMELCVPEVVDIKFSKSYGDIK